MHPPCAQVLERPQVYFGSGLWHCQVCGCPIDFVPYPLAAGQEFSIGKFAGEAARNVFKMHDALSSTYSTFECSVDLDSKTFIEVVSGADVDDLFPEPVDSYVPLR
jgi:hypothetical protein